MYTSCRKLNIIQVNHYGSISALRLETKTKTMLQFESRSEMHKINGRLDEEHNADTHLNIIIEIISKMDKRI